MPLLSPKLSWDLAQTRWAGTLNPVLSLPILNGNQINNVDLDANTPTVINHLLQRMPQGWIVTDNMADTSIWRTAEWTTTSITLEASADTTISLWVY